MPRCRNYDAELAAIEKAARGPSLVSVLIPAAVLFLFAAGWFLAYLYVYGWSAL